MRFKNTPAATILHLQNMESVVTAQSMISSLWQQRPLIISGPCSAETEEQVLQSASSLAATGKVHLFRAGIWKPRTRPGSFEGVGEAGLLWMQRAKALTGLP